MDVCGGVSTSFIKKKSVHNSWMGSLWPDQSKTKPADGPGNEIGNRADCFGGPRFHGAPLSHSKSIWPLMIALSAQHHSFGHEMRLDHLGRHPLEPALHKSQIIMRFEIIRRAAIWASQKDHREPAARFLHACGRVYRRPAGNKLSSWDFQIEYCFDR